MNQYGPGNNGYNGDTKQTSIYLNDKIRADSPKVSRNSKRNTNDQVINVEAPKERWKRENDKKLYQFLREHCSRTGDSIVQIYHRLNQNPDNELSFWTSICGQLKWKGPVSMLQNRFIKLHNMKGLSIREKIFLKKLLD